MRIDGLGLPYPNSVNAGMIKDGSVTESKFANPDSVHSSDMGRQALINSNFDIWQRGTSFVNPAGFTADHWIIDNGVTGGTLPTTLTHSQIALTSGEIPGSFWAYRITTDGAGTIVSSGDHYFLDQLIENGTRYLCGNSISVSFYARSSIAGKRIGVTPAQFYGTGGSPSAANGDAPGANFTLSTTWQKFTLVFPTIGLTGKTFGTNNDDYIAIRFAYAWGQGWRGAVGATTNETFVGAGTIDIAQIQVNSGTVPLPYNPNHPSIELDRCMRYFQAFTTPVGDWFMGVANATGLAVNVVMRLSKKMRTLPPSLTLDPTGWTLSDSASANVPITGIDVIGKTDESIILVFHTNTAAASSTCLIISPSGTYLTLSAELT
jgi:hypothetical protein